MEFRNMALSCILNTKCKLYGCSVDDYFPSLWVYLCGHALSLHNASKNNTLQCRVCSCKDYNHWPL